MTATESPHRSLSSSDRRRPRRGFAPGYINAVGVWCLLGRRTKRLGGTCAIIGGSLKPGESAFVGALREFEDELSGRCIR